MYFTLKRKVTEEVKDRLTLLSEQSAEQHKTLAAAMETNRKETKEDINNLHSKMDSMRSEIREDIKDVSSRVTHLEREK